MQTDQVIADMANMDLTDITRRASSETSNGVCARCSGPATQLCNGCVDAPLGETGQTLKTYYCNTTCQKADWTNHKSVCKVMSARKRLYRAGDTVQRIFYAYREQAFEKSIIKVERDENTLYLYEGQYGKDEVLVPFPYHLLGDANDREAVLSYWACTDAVAFMLLLVRTLLKGLYSRIEEVTMDLHKTPRKTYIVDEHRDPHQRDFPHVIFRVKLQNNELYALDLSGAQYGYRETVVPWPQYEQSRLSNGSNKIIEIKECGSCRDAVRASSGRSDLYGVVMRYNFILSDKARSASDDFVKKEGNESLSEMLKLGQATYEGKRDRLVNYISKSLADFKAHQQENGGRFRAIDPDNAGAVRSFIAQAASRNVNIHYV